MVAARARERPGRVRAAALAAGYTAAFWYHFCAGLRHLNFDLGRGLDKASARRSGAIVVVATLILSGATLAAMLHYGPRP